MHWPLTGLLPPWAPGAAHMLWRQRPDVSQRQLVLGCQGCIKTVIQGPYWRQFNGTKPVLDDCPTQLTLISHLLIFPFISCSCSSIRKWNGQSDKITNFGRFSTFFCHFFSNLTSFTHIRNQFWKKFSPNLIFLAAVETQSFYSRL